MKFLIQTIGGAEFVDVPNLMHAQGAVIGLKKTYAVNVYRKRTKKADKKLFAFFTYIFYTIKKRDF